LHGREAGAVRVVAMRAAREAVVGVAGVVRAAVGVVKVA